MRGVVKVGAVTLQGLHGSKVTVEAALTRQLPGIGIVGLPDTAILESKQRVRYATQSLGLHLSDRYILINLQPAEIPKYGSGFDLAIAVAAYAISSSEEFAKLQTTAHIGELSLDGRCVRPRGLLPAVLAAKEAGFQRVMVPSEARKEASLVDGIEVVGVDTLQGALNWHRGKSGQWVKYETGESPCAEEPRPMDDDSTLEILGQAQAVFALVVAAAGGHHIMLEGSPGAGKTLLAQTLPRLLPLLDSEEALTVTSLRSLMSFDPVKSLCSSPPFEQPHHTATVASMIGTGRGGQVLPGSVSLASSGVLFLDEVPHFSGSVLDSLRQPLESGTITIHRASTRVTLPAAVQLVLAQNPCPCGKAGGTLNDATCTCTSLQVRRYQGKLSGPLRDRLDVHVRVPRVSTARVIADDTYRASLSDLRAQVLQARSRCRARLRGTPWNRNAQVPAKILLQGQLSLPSHETRVLDQALELGNITLRGYVRTLRLAWSIADVQGEKRPDRGTLAQALMLKEVGAI